MTSLAGHHRPRSSASSSTSTPASAARPARPAARNGTRGGYSAPLTDQEPYGADPHGAWLNRIHGFEVGEGANSQTVHFPRSCLHCEEPDCVTVCPTGASYKRAEDGIVLVNPDTCIGCKLCSWACPYGAREYDYGDGVMKKCTLCVDRIYNEELARGGPRAGLRARLPDRRAPFRRSGRSATARYRSWWPSAAASTCCPSSATSRSTSTCRRARAATPRRSKASRPRTSDAAPGSAADRLFAWVDRVLSASLIEPTMTRMLPSSTFAACAPHPRLPGRGRGWGDAAQPTARCEGGPAALRKPIVPAPGSSPHP